MAFRAELVLVLDNGQYAFLPRPPASTSGLAYGLTDTNGTLAWSNTSVPSSQWLPVANGNPADPGYLFDANGNPILALVTGL